MKKILKKSLVTIDGKDCIELLVSDSLLKNDCSCDFCDYRADYRGVSIVGEEEEEVECWEYHGCGRLTSSYFVLLDLVSLIL